MAALDSVAEVASLLEKWESDNGDHEKVITTLKRIADIVESETESWYKMDPDPFDDRHPGRADPTCALGHVLKSLFKNDNFMNMLVNSYLATNRDNTDLHIAASRLLLDVMPGLETTVVFQDNDPLVDKLMTWAKSSSEPLQSYSTGLLAGAMEVPDIAAKFKDKNAELVPLLLKRLHELQKLQKAQCIVMRSPRVNHGAGENLTERPFAIFSKFPKRESKEEKSKQPEHVEALASSVVANGTTSNKDSKTTDKRSMQSGITPPPKKSKKLDMGSPSNRSPTKNISTLGLSPKKQGIAMEDCSNSSWCEVKPFIVGTYSLSPLTVEMQQRLILHYLTPLGEYQELLSHVFEHEAMGLIFFYIDLHQNRDVRLAFEALKYLAGLLCHKKFAVEFISRGGVQCLLDVYRPSVAATGVSMCLYYLAYFEDAMERVCLLPHCVITKLVNYVLWLLECSHESGRCHATMFYSLAFPFRVILELFDMNDGLRKLYNVMSTLEIVRIEESTRELTEDEVFTSRQAARHVCVAIKKYVEAHLAIKADQIRRTHVRNEGGSPFAEGPAYKAAKYPTEVIQDNIELLLECLPFRMRWDPVIQITKLGGVQLLLQLVAMAVEWNAYTGKGETIRSALDVLAVCTVTPKTQLLLCEAISLPDEVSSPAISILLGLAEGEVIADPEIQKSALNVIINCVCGPQSRLSGNIGRIVGGSAKKKNNLKNGEALLSKMWDVVRSNNGIMVLLKLLTVKTPITEADSIRALACRALVGLCRCERVEQIVSKLPLFNNGQLTMLMKEPVLQDKRQEHVKFCKHATELIEMISGKPQNAAIGASLDKIRMAHVVAQTKIVYNEKELLQLIYEHLQAKELYDAALALQTEAELPKPLSLQTSLPASPHLYLSPVASKSRMPFSSPSTPGPRSVSMLSAVGTPGPSRISTSTPGSAGPIKLNILHSKTQSPTLNNQTRLQQTKKIIRHKHEASNSMTFSSPALRRQSSVKQPESTISLDKIVTEYLRKQHATCQNPVVTCPPFSLLQPHRCPEPTSRNTAPYNMASRLFKKSIIPRYGGLGGKRNDRKYVYSRFRPVRSYRDAEDVSSFLCCAFSADEEYLMLGTSGGELKMYNVQSGEEGASYVCHNSPVTHCEPSRNGSLVLTSCSWGRPTSAVWAMTDMFELKHAFEDDLYVEFSKVTQDLIIGTTGEKAHIYDVTTGRLITTLYDENKANNYTRNRATFSPTDDLALNDGVLWDVNGGVAVHKFDKFNPDISGVFHPAGTEIIINSEVWDLRTFHLLHTVPALDQCTLRFNHAGDVIYGTIHQNEEDDSLEENSAFKSPYGSSFRTFDGADYSNIATIDVKKNIFDLCTDSSDCYLAVIEDQRGPDSISEESICRLYEVGRLKDEDDDLAEEEEDEVDGLDDDDDEEDDDDDDADPDGDQTDNDGDDAEIADAQDGQGNDDSDTDGDDDDEDTDDISDITTDNDDDDDLDNVYFELSDLSNF